MPNQDRDDVATGTSGSSGGGNNNSGGGDAPGSGGSGGASGGGGTPGGGPGGSDNSSGDSRGGGGAGGVTERGGNITTSGKPAASDTNAASTTNPATQATPGVSGATQNVSGPGYSQAQMDAGMAAASQIGSSIADTIASTLGSISTGLMSGIDTSQAIQDSMNQAISTFSGTVSGAVQNSVEAVASTLGFTGGTQYAGLDGNAGIVANELSRLGWSDTQIAGIVGRFQQESYARLDPTAVRVGDAPSQPGELANSIGIGQWNGPRREALQNFADAAGQPITDLRTQVDFFDDEIRNNPAESRALNAITNANSVADVVTGMMHYERPESYSVSNPTAGHGYNAAVANANSIAGSLAEGGITTSDVGALGSAAAGIADMLGPVTGGISDAIGLATSVIGNSPATAEIAAGAVPGYTDPSVANVGIGAGTTPTTSAATPTTPAAKRRGIAGLTQTIEEGKPIATIKSLKDAITNPLGFALDTVADAIHQNGGLKIGGVDITDPNASMDDLVKGLFSGVGIDLPDWNNGTDGPPADLDSESRGDSSGRDREDRPSSDNPPDQDPGEGYEWRWTGSRWVRVRSEPEEDDEPDEPSTPDSIQQLIWEPAAMPIMDAFDWSVLR